MIQALSVTTLAGLTTLRSTESRGLCSAHWLGRPCVPARGGVVTLRAQAFFHLCASGGWRGPQWTTGAPDWERARQTPLARRYVCSSTSSGHNHGPRQEKSSRINDLPSNGAHTTLQVKREGRQSSASDCVTAASRPTKARRTEQSGGRGPATREARDGTAVDKGSHGNSSASVQASSRANIGAGRCHVVSITPPSGRY